MQFCTRPQKFFTGAVAKCCSVIPVIEFKIHLYCASPNRVDAVGEIVVLLGFYFGLRLQIYWFCPNSVLQCRLIIAQRNFQRRAIRRNLWHKIDVILSCFKGNLFTDSNTHALKVLLSLYNFCTVPDNFQNAS